MYRMIAEDLRRKIESGELPRDAEGRQDPSAPLPTENDLQKGFGASRNTIRDAIKWLISLGLVETRAGQGTYVVPKKIPFVTTLTGDPVSRHGGETLILPAESETSDREPDTRDLKVQILQATEAVAKSLRLKEGARVISRRQERFLDDMPWSLQTTFYPMSLVEQGATKLMHPEDIEDGAVRYLAREFDVTQVGYRDTIAVRPPEVAEAWFFRLPADGRISVFEIFRVGFDEAGNRIRLTVSVYPADRNRFRVEVGKVPSHDAVMEPDG